MNTNREKIVFESIGTKNEESFYVIEQTKLNGVNYILVADSDEDEAEALILKQKSEENEELIYEIVEDDTELELISKIFEELLEDVEIDM